MNEKEKVLVTGACGQIGSTLTRELRKIYGESNVIATDITTPDDQRVQSGPFEHLDVLDKQHLNEIIGSYQVTHIYHLAAMLSAKGEEKPLLAWKLNMDGLLNILEIARERKLGRIFWPSSIAVFGDRSPKQNTPQRTIMEPNTVYGISKIAGEGWCDYYHKKYGVDVRSVRYPGLIGYDALPGGGTTDYAVDIYHKALEGEIYSCFLSGDTFLPMMYMPDAIRAVIELMHAKASDVKIRTSYNISGMSFSPSQLAMEIKKHIPEFTIRYNPDNRQAIADSWPASIDDSEARRDWGWKPGYNIAEMTTDMLKHLKMMKKEHAS
jgi:nucleoside-diphosphate-sugar epimerase